MTGTSDQVLVEVYDAAADPEELDRLTRSLREEILQVDAVDSVSAASAGPAPDGTRGLDVAAVGALVVAVAPTVEALGRILGVLRSFLARSKPGAPTATLKVTVNGETLELTPTVAQQQALVDAFLARAGEAPA